MAGSQYGSAINCNIDIDTSSLKGKTAVITGGAKGIGAAYGRALLSAGAYVVIGDLDVTEGKAFQAQYPERLLFVECNVVKWESQLHLFQEAAKFSPTSKIHHVVANAGICRTDDQVYSYEADPAEPELSTIEVIVNGTLYTAKLAMHYFVKQNGTTPSPSQEDTSLILIGSGAAIHDVLRIPQYCAAKWAIRGLMHGLRRTAPLYGSRVNVINPWTIETTILPPQTYELFKSRAIQYATLEDAGQCLLRIVSDRTISGRSLFVAPRKWAPRGYIDMDLEDTEENELRKEIQFDQMKFGTVDEGLFL